MTSLIFVLTAISIHAAPPPAKDVFAWLDKGAKLSAGAADKLEGRLKKKPTDSGARVQLLAYYTHEGIPESRPYRLRHISWLLEHDPHERAGLAQVASGVLVINCTGDPLADRPGFEQVLPLWLRLGAKDKKSSSDAARAIEHCAPEEAAKLLAAADNRAGLAQLYAGAALGITGMNYKDSEPSGTDPALRETAFAQRAVEALQAATRSASDKEFLAGAASALLRDGGLLWADGKLDWDYTALGRALLAPAILLNPENLHLLTLRTELPKRGERPASTLRVGGNVMVEKLIRQPKPSYPAEAKSKGVEGTVKMTALVGLDGKIIGLNLESGPQELVRSAMDAVRQWEYKVTLLNGRPCFIITRIDVNFVLSASPVAD